MVLRDQRFGNVFVPTYGCSQPWFRKRCGPWGRFLGGYQNGSQLDGWCYSGPSGERGLGSGLPWAVPRSNQSPRGPHLSGYDQHRLSAEDGWFGDEWKLAHPFFLPGSCKRKCMFWESTIPIFPTTFRQHTENPIILSIAIPGHQRTHEHPPRIKTQRPKEKSLAELCSTLPNLWWIPRAKRLGKLENPWPKNHGQKPTCPFFHIYTLWE